MSTRERMDRADALRYRYLLDPHNLIPTAVWGAIGVGDKVLVDAAIDAELAKQPPIWETSEPAAVDCIKDTNEEYPNGT